MDNLMEIAERLKANLKPMETKYKCEVCKDTGLIETTKEDGLYKTYRDCECVIKERNKRNIDRANYSELFKNRDFDNYKTDTRAREGLKNKCLEFLQQNDAKTIALLGNVGCGKTHLAVSILKEFANQNKTVNAINYTELTRKLSSNANDEIAYFSILGKYANVPVLLLDDMFKGKITEANIKQMYDLINTRYENRRITIITSERVIDELMNIDEAVASRIVEMAKQEFILNITKMENYRLKGES